MLKRPFLAAMRRVIVIALALGGCAGTTASSPPPTSTPAAAQAPAEQWLAGKPCAPPCWENITPGQTSSADGEAIIAQFKTLQPINRYHDEATQAFWRWADYPEAGGQIRYHKTKPPFGDPPLDTVIAIMVKFERPVSLAEVIEAYGEPSHGLLVAQYEATYRKVTYSFGLVYLDRGFILGSSQIDAFKRPAISASMLFDGIELFPPGAAGFDMAVSLGIRNPSPLLVAWQGMDADSIVYCRERNPENEHKGCE